jgi:cytochrome c biogenesis protein CcdA
MLVALVFVAAVAVSRAEAATIERIEAQGPTVKRWGGRVLIAVGAWFLILALFAGSFERLFPV